MPFSEVQDGDVEVNLEMMCDGKRDRSEEIEDGSFVSVLWLWCVSFFSILLIFWNVFRHWLLINFSRTLLTSLRICVVKKNVLWI